MSKRVTTSVKLDPAVRDEARRLTSAAGTSIGAVCEAALRRYIITRQRKERTTP